MLNSVEFFSFFYYLCKHLNLSMIEGVLLQRGETPVVLMIRYEH